MPRLCLRPLLVAAALAVTAASAPGVAAAAPAPAPGPSKLSVGVEVLRFASAGKTVTATGQVTGNLTDYAGHTTAIKSTVQLAASTGGSGCRVLHLYLNELTLQLLGLNAHLDKVTLDITGQAKGGVLGALFCRLSHAKAASTRASLARALTAGVRRGHGHALRFSANLNPTATTSQAPAPSCPVLDLVVGPLNLQLLGLVVDLQKVHLNVVATRGGGKLGDLFCQLAT
ncbi:MAG: hypothetical protein NVSMB51_14290 [Solirubrobacteraceae bacterium]